jgi:hypothetical protein
MDGHICPYHGLEATGSGAQESAQSAWDQLDKLKTKR